MLYFQVNLLTLYTYQLAFCTNICCIGFAYEQTEVDIEPSKATSDSNYKIDDRKRGYLSFKIASNSEYKLER